MEGGKERGKELRRDSGNELRRMRVYGPIC